MVQDPKALQDTEAQLRSLGIALVKGWNLLPLYAQDQLLDQACNFDPSRTAQEMRRSLRLALEKKLLLKANPKAESLASYKNPATLQQRGKLEAT